MLLEVMSVGPDRRSQVNSSKQQRLIVKSDMLENGAFPNRYGGKVGYVQYSAEATDLQMRYEEESYNRAEILVNVCLNNANARHDLR